MLVDCPECRRSYRVDDADLGPRGRVVICPRCDARWYQRGVEAAAAEVATWSRVRTSEHPAPGAVADSRAGGGYAQDLKPAALAAGRPAPSDALRRGIGFAAAAVVVATTACGAIGARAAVVRMVPRTASLYAAIGWPVNLRGLRFVHVLPMRGDRAPADVSVGGTVRNVARAEIDVPRFVYEVRDAAGATLVRWSEAPPVPTLAAGKTLSFASRPQRMPPDGRSVLVSFEDPRPDDGALALRRRLASR